MLAEEQMGLSLEEMFLMFEKNWAPRQFSNHTVEGANLSCFQDRCWCTDNIIWFEIWDYLIFTLWLLGTELMIQKGPVPVRNQ